MVNKLISNRENQSSCHHNPSSEKNENLSEVKEKNDSLKVKISFLFEGGSVFCPDFYGCQRIAGNARRICCRQGNSAVSDGTAADFYFAAEDN